MRVKRDVCYRDAVPLVRRLTPWIVGLAIAAAGGWIVRRRLGIGFFPAFDLYAYFYPKLLYALAAARDGGRGLLWNPYQSCGHPFFAVSQTGLLYPPYAAFLATDPEQALAVVAWLHLVLGGAGTYLLGRQLGARPAAALAGALVFEMGNAMVALTISSPTHVAPYAWMPAALWAAERVLRVPSVRRVVVLTTVLAVTLLPGMPQTVWFLYQVILLRILWEIATRRPVRARRGAMAVGAALVVAPLLAAVQVWPEVEVALQSLRTGVLSAGDLLPFGRWDADAFRRQLITRSLTQPLLPVPCMLVVASLFARRTRRAAAFYWTMGLLYFALSLGPATPLFRWYTHLPGGSAFRDPQRFAWMTSFALAVSTALGCEALATRRSGPPGRTAGMVIAMAVPPLALWTLAWTSPEALLRDYEATWHVTLTPATLVLSRWDWAAALLLVLAALAAGGAKPRGGWIRVVALAGLAVPLVASPWASPLSRLPAAPAFAAHAAAFAPIAGALGPQDRLYLVHEHPLASEFTLMPKTPSLFRLPAILDYEPLTPRRYAEYSVMLRNGTHLRGLTDFLARGPEPGPGFRRRLLDLAAVRWVVTAPRFTEWIARLEPPLQRRYTMNGLTVWENPARLPRAFWVPRVEVIPDGNLLLELLANGSDDLRRVAFLEAPPASGFLGKEDDAVAPAVRFLENRPEHVAIEVHAPARGFLVLSDQYFPGWSATVDGREVPIERANHVFRLVEVPGGRVRVDFRYAPRSLRLGAVLSSVTALALLALAGSCSGASRGRTPDRRRGRR